MFVKGFIRVQNLLTEQEVAEFLKISVHKLRRDRSIGGGIPYIKIGNIVRYTWESLQNYISGNIYQNTSQYKDSVRIQSSAVREQRP